MILSRRLGACALSLIAAVAALGAATKPTREPHWRKIVVDAAFRSEGVAVADVNRDGKPDILVGDYWYEAPNWKRHEIRPPRTDLGDGANGYSDAFCCFVGDFNGDGWPDLLVVGFPGKPAFWYENPGRDGIATEAHWKQHPVSASACNETPNYVDLFGDGQKYLVMATQPEGQMFWFAPSRDPDKPWHRHPISASHAPGTDVFSHGLGWGDMNNDGRADILVKQGWWEQPADARTRQTPWTFHPANLGDDCANMYAVDLNGDGRADVVSSSSHNRGVWWHEQQPDGSFVRHVIEERFTESHAMNRADINGDGRLDYVTGKRWWAHGPHGDVDPNAAPVLYWIDAQPQKNGPPQFTTHLIDDASGIGTQFVTEDINSDGRVDIVVSNKRGVFLFEQVR